MAALVDQCTKKVEISAGDYTAILQQVQSYLSGGVMVPPEVPDKK